MGGWVGGWGGASPQAVATGEVLVLAVHAPGGLWHCVQASVHNGLLQSHQAAVPAAWRLTSRPACLALGPTLEIILDVHYQHQIPDVTQLLVCLTSYNIPICPCTCPCPLSERKFFDDMRAQRQLEQEARFFKVGPWLVEAAAVRGWGGDDR